MHVIDAIQFHGKRNFKGLEMATKNGYVMGYMHESKYEYSFTALTRY
jgi:hypothetical protein